jgi:hypothetical protein
MTILTWNGQQINQRDNDGMVNLTQMAQANDATVGHWIELDSTPKYLQEVASSIGIPIDEILITKVGSIKNGGGSWGHPLVAIAFAQWISPRFHVWCNRHIKTLMETGSTALQSKVDKLTALVAQQSEMFANLSTSIQVLEAKIAKIDTGGLTEDFIDLLQDTLRNTENFNETTAMNMNTFEMFAHRLDTIDKHLGIKSGPSMLFFNSAAEV